MRRNLRRTTGLAVTAAATAAAALVTGLGLPWLRVVAGLPLVLVLPGYALSMFVVPRVPSRLSPVLWRGMWTVGLSLAVAVLGGLLLNLTPAGLTRVSWTILLAVVTLIALGAAAWLRTGTERRAGTGRPTWVAAGYPVAALALAGTAVGLAVVSGGWQHSPAFAQLWLVPAGERATLGVRSAYPDAQAFHLVLDSGTRPAGAWDFTLTAGQTWQRTVMAPAGQRVTALLTAIGNDQTETVAITSKGTA
jgi:hypothetical protein